MSFICLNGILDLSSKSLVSNVTMHHELLAAKSTKKELWKIKYGCM